MNKTVNNNNYFTRYFTATHGRARHPHINTGYDVTVVECDVTVVEYPISDVIVRDDVT